MTNAVAADLSKIDPGNAKTYEANAAAYVASLDQLTADISAETKPLQANPSSFSMMPISILKSALASPLSAAFPMSRPPPLPPNA